MKIRIGLATVAIALFAAPVVVWATGTPHEGPVSEQNYISTGAHITNSANWQTVPGLTFAAPSMHGPIAVSADLTQGKAMFRLQTTNLIGSPGTSFAEPGAAEFVGPGAQAFIFYNSHDCQGVTVEWKRVGNVAVHLSKASIHATFDIGSGCG